MSAGTLYAIASLVLFGIWGFGSKLATDVAGPRFVFVFAQIPYIVIAAAMYVFGGPYHFTWNGMRWTVLMGTFGAFGVLCYVLAIGKMPASRVVPITAAYPALTILLSWAILHEKLTLRHLLGVAFALAGVALLA